MHSQLFEQTSCEVYVSVPFTDLRKRPILRQSSLWEKDFLQESQCLFGERLRVLEKKEDWLFVHALEQGFCASSGDWQGYPGWVKACDVSTVQTGGSQDGKESFFVCKKFARIDFSGGGETYLPFASRLFSVAISKGEHHLLLPCGSKAFVSEDSLEKEIFLRQLSENEKRHRLIDYARLFLGDPYFWGGRGAWDKHLKEEGSVDCSALVSLVYRLCGIQVPRNACDQFLFCRRISPDQLQMGDLIFFSNQDRPGFINHVMIFIDDETLIESTEDSMSVREVSLRDRLGKEKKELKRGERGKKNLFYGSCFSVV